MAKITKPKGPPPIDVQEIVLTIFDHSGNATTRELAADLGIRPSTLETWMRKHPEIRSAVREMRSYVDDSIESALAKRAKGYNVTETTTKVEDDGATTVTTKDVHIPPDVAASKFWLSNRRRDKWTDRQVVEVTGNLQHILAHLDDTFDLTEDDWKELPNE